MAEWLYEAGLGEERAALVADGEIVEAHLRPDDAGLQPGAAVAARLVQLLPRGQALARAGREELLVDGLTGETQGAEVHVLIERSALPEPGKRKRAKARLTVEGECAAPSFRDHLVGAPVRNLRPHRPDALEAAGWSELLEEAARGEVAFAGGALRLSLTPAMTLLDVDGTLDPEPLALAGATAAARTIRRFGVGGSIGLDLPTVGSRAVRQQVGELLDFVLPRPFERTAMNGFGFVQIVRPRLRPSLPELLQFDAVPAAARALLRRAERSGLAGAITLTAAPPVIAWLDRRHDLLQRLAETLGGPVSLRADPALAIWSGHAGQA